MKTFVIYVDGHEQSTYQAEQCMKSLQKGFEGELFKGTTPATLSQYESKHNFPLIENARLEAFSKEDQDKYLTKKSCFYNHVRLWEKCIELDEPIVFAEHDAHCVREWDNIDFDEVLVLNVESAMTNKRGPIGPSELDRKSTV